MRERERERERVETDRENVCAHVGLKVIDRGEREKKNRGKFGCGVLLEKCREGKC